MTIGTGDFWFYPSWTMYPPSIDWETVYIAGASWNRWGLLPEFYWPHGAGSFDGAMFLAAIVHNGDLVSNLAETYFGWSEAPQPTPTPSGPSPTPEPTATPAGPFNPGDLYTVDIIVGNMRFVPAGTFTQGSPSNEPCRWPHEGPQFQHTLTQNLAVMQTEITRGMWSDLKAVQPMLPNDPSHMPTSPTMDHPVQMVTWYEAVLFSNLLSLQHGLTPCYYLDDTFETIIDETNYITNDVYCNFDANGYRLPTEGEREHFTRAGTSGSFWLPVWGYTFLSCNTCHAWDWDLDDLHNIAWWCGNSWFDSGQYNPHPVGSLLANPGGLHDIYGNVFEWCWDWYSATYPTGSATDDTGPTTGTNRVLRGGCFACEALYCRSAFRYRRDPDLRRGTHGFRLVRTVP